MAATESDILRDESERSNLQRAIADLETAILVSNPDTRHVLERSVAGAKARVVTLDKKIEEAKVQRAAEVQAQVIAAAVLAAKETALNTRERETYKGFLEESYFTRKDFGRLDEFYTHSYDRLSESGKDEMSKRIDAGIERGEFKFSDLPKNALKKEMDHRAARADKKSLAQGQSGQHEENSSFSAPPAERTAINAINLGSVDLSGVKLAEAASIANTAPMPNIANSKILVR